MQKNETRPLSTPHTRMNSKWNKDLNFKPQTIKTLEENTGSKISDISCNNIFFSLSPWARGKKQIELHQTKKILCSKENCQQNERPSPQWENIFINTSDNGLISKI